MERKVEKAEKVEKVAFLLSLMASLSFLLAGGIIYLKFRSTSLRMFQWADNIGLGPALHKFNSGRAGYHVPEWVVYTLPDGLWVMSYVVLIATIWEFDLRRSIALILLVPSIAVGIEVLQAMGCAPGTFDPADMLAYFLGTVLGLMLVVLFRNLSTIVY